MIKQIFFFFISLLKYSCCALLHVTGVQFTVFEGFTSFIVIIKYWLYSLCCTIYPCSLFYLFLAALGLNAERGFLLLP